MKPTIVSSFVKSQVVEALPHLDHLYLVILEICSQMGAV